MCGVLLLCFMVVCVCPIFSMRAPTKFILGSTTNWGRLKGRAPTRVRTHTHSPRPPKTNTRGLPHPSPQRETRSSVHGSTPSKPKKKERGGERVGSGPIIVAKIAQTCRPNSAGFLLRAAQTCSCNIPVRASKTLANKTRIPRPRRETLVHMYMYMLSYYHLAPST